MKNTKRNLEKLYQDFSVNFYQRNYYRMKYTITISPIHMLLTHCTKFILGKWQNASTSR